MTTPDIATPAKGKDSRRPQPLLITASWRACWPFFVMGGIGIIAGGIASAASAGSPSYLASWAVAYLVLVVGVAQIAFGAGVAALMRADQSTPPLGAIFALFNLGNAGVLAGTLLQDRMNQSVLLVDLGSLLLAGSLLLGLRIARGAAPSRFRVLFMLLVAGLLISILIGMVLAHR